MIRLNLWFLPRAFLRTGAMGEAFTRHSLRPHSLCEGELYANNSGAIAPREGEVMLYQVVIASGAKTISAEAVWIASARRLSSGRALRGPVGASQ
jgi:hypothetical protein